MEVCLAHDFVAPISAMLEKNEFIPHSAWCRFVNPGKELCDHLSKGFYLRSSIDENIRLVSFHPEISQLALRTLRNEKNLL